MKRIFSLIYLLSSTILFSQIDDENFKVTTSDLEISTYEKDTTANAFVMYEKGISFVESKSFNLITVIKKKIKILNKNGFDAANIEIPIYGNKDDSEGVSNIEATTYNLRDNGLIEKTTLKKSEIYLDNKGNYSVVKFPMPNIQEGSVIEYSYVIKSPFMFKFKEWYFQDYIPKEYSEYVTSIPGNWQYNIKLVGFLKVDSKDTEIRRNCLNIGARTYASCVDTKYIMKDVPAFKDEDYMTSSLNFLSRLDFELKKTTSFYGRTKNITKTWKSAEKELKSTDFFGKQINKKSTINNILPDSIKSLENNIEKAKAIYNYVLENYRWNGTYLQGNSKIREVRNDKTGNVFSINLLLKNLLSSEKFETKPILLSTRKNGYATKLYPVISDFNYLIIQLKLGEKEFLLDATDPYLPFGELPYRCLNGYGRLFDFKKESKWVDINAPNYSINQQNLSLELNSDFILNGNFASNRSGYLSHDLRQTYFENKEGYPEFHRNKYPNLSIENLVVKTKNKNDKGFQEASKINYQLDFINGKSYFNPFIVKFFENNPFKLKERNYPIDFGFKSSYQYNLELDLKDNLKVLDIPAPKNIALPNNSGSAIFMVSVEGQKIRLFLKIKLDRAIYEAEYYEALKIFMSKIIEIQNNTVITLEKK